MIAGEGLVRRMGSTKDRATIDVLTKNELSLITTYLLRKSHRTQSCYCHSALKNPEQPAERCLTAFRPATTSHQSTRFKTVLSLRSHCDATDRINTTNRQVLCRGWWEMGNFDKRLSLGYMLLDNQHAP